MPSPGPAACYRCFLSPFFWLRPVALGEAADGVRRLIEQCSRVFFVMMNGIMKLAPIGAGGAMAFTVGKYGVAALTPLADLMLSFYLTCILFVVVVLGSIAAHLPDSISCAFLLTSRKSC